MYPSILCEESLNRKKNDWTGYIIYVSSKRALENSETAAGLPVDTERDPARFSARNENRPARTRRTWRLQLAAESLQRCGHSWFDMDIA